MRKTYLMPPEEETPVQATRVRTVRVDGIEVELWLLRLRPGVYSTSWLYKPPAEALAAAGAAARGGPAILMLPGHGDPAWSPAVQCRCLSFARRGYVVMMPEPFGQDERGEAPLFNESHDSQATAFLLATGQSLLGLVMADHQAELTWLAAGGRRSAANRGDRRVDGRDALAVACGHRHAAGGVRARRGGPGGVARLGHAASRTVRHDGRPVRRGRRRNPPRLVAPRPYLEIIPGVQRPVSAEGIRLLDEGAIGTEEAIRRFAVPQEQLDKEHPYTREVYRRAGLADDYRLLVVDGPHDYTPAMRAIAAG